MALDQPLNRLYDALEQSIVVNKSKASSIPDIDESLELQEALNRCLALLEEGNAFVVDEMLHQITQRIDFKLSQF